jgi:hypothetical protein
MVFIHVWVSKMQGWAFFRLNFFALLNTAGTKKLTFSTWKLDPGSSCVCLVEVKFPPSQYVFPSFAYFLKVVPSGLIL